MSTTSGPRKLTKQPKPSRRPPSPVESVPGITIEPSVTDSINNLSEFFDGLLQWKNHVSELGSRFDKYVIRLDNIERMYLSALEKTRITAIFFAQLSDSMHLVNKVIELSKQRSADHSTQSLVNQSLQRCDKMVASCEESYSSFVDLYTELLSIQEDIQEDIILCDGQIKGAEKSKNRLIIANRITQAVTLVATAAASLMTVFVAFGTPLVALPLAFSVIAPIVSLNLNNRAQACEARAKKPRKELEAFIELNNGIDIGSNRVRMILHWWDDIRKEVMALHNEIEQGTQQSGSRKVETTKAEQWKALERRLDEYGAQVQELIDTQRQRQSRSSSPSSTSTGRLSSHLSEYGFGSPPQNLSSLSRSSSRSSTNSSKSDNSVRSTHSQPAAAAVKKIVRDRGLLQTQATHVSWG